jgi:hypothetical protein
MSYLPTEPGTRISFEATRRDRPCWRCRFHLRWPPWRKHWNCTFGPMLQYVKGPGNGDDR